MRLLIPLALLIATTIALPVDPRSPSDTAKSIADLVDGSLSSDSSAPAAPAGLASSVQRNGNGYGPSPGYGYGPPPAPYPGYSGGSLSPGPYGQPGSYYSPPPPPSYGGYGARGYKKRGLSGPSLASGLGTIPGVVRTIFNRAG